MSDNDFKLVKSKKRSKNLAPSNDAMDLYKRVADCKSKLQDYDQHFYWAKVKLELRNEIRKYFEGHTGDRVVNIVCYGLGSVDENLSARYQLALLLLIIDEIEIMNEIIKIEFVELYDPVFTEVDRKLLIEFYKFIISEKNDQCFRKLKSILMDLKLKYS